MVAAQYLFSLWCMPGFSRLFSFDLVLINQFGRAPRFRQKRWNMTRWGGLSVIALKDFDRLVNESWMATFKISPFRHEWQILAVNLSV